MDPVVVVGIDFGTTYSGFSYAHSNKPGEVLSMENWPSWNEAGGRPYCKTQTSLFYAPTAPSNSLELQGWGWPALLKYSKALEQIKHGKPYQICDDTNRDDFVNAVQLNEQTNDVGYFVTKFKLMLAPDYDGGDFPCGLSAEKLISDYLRCLSEFALDHLKKKYGRHIKKSDVKWCITVPAIWDGEAKQRMKMCCEMAGMVEGKYCSDRSSSPHSLCMVLEPEAASMYCQEKLDAGSLNCGDNFLVVDIGGGTIDLVVHQITDSKLYEVHEAVANCGETGGGTFVDANFFKYVHQEIGCFKDFILQNPKYFPRVLKWWLDKKCCFTGPSSDDGIAWDIPCKLASAWKEFDRSKGVFKPDDAYEELHLTPQLVQQFFDTEMTKIISLIRKQLGSLQGGEKCKGLLVVGGLSENTYVVNQIEKEFAGDVEHIMVPINPASAVVRGAVKFGFHPDLVLSRKSKRSYGIQTTRGFKNGDPSSYMQIDDDGEKICRNVFCVYVEKNHSVKVDSSITHIFNPRYHQQKELQLTMFSSEEDRCPAYITDEGCVEESTYAMDISQDLHLDKGREVEVQMYFGKSNIEVTGKRLNFGDPKPVKLFFVKFEGHKLNKTHH